MEQRGEKKLSSLANDLLKFIFILSRLEIKNGSQDLMVTNGLQENLSCALR